MTHEPMVWSDPTWLGSTNAETPAEAYQFAAEIAQEHEQRVHLFPVGRGEAGQLMWDVATVFDGGTHDKRA